MVFDKHSFKCQEVDKNNQVKSNFLNLGTTMRFKMFKAEIKKLQARSDLHIMRKIWHMVSGIIILYTILSLPFPLKSSAFMAMIVGGLALLFDYMRLRDERMNKTVIAVLGPFMRESEKSHLSGLPFYLLGLSTSLFLFDKPIAILSILFLIVADPMASFFGILYGKSHDKMQSNKSLQGAAASFIFCYLITLFFGLSYDANGGLLLLFALCGAAIGSLAELISFKIDDNLTIPLISGLGLTIANLLLGVL